MMEDIAAEHALGQPLRLSDLNAFAAEGVPRQALTWSAWGDLSIVARDRVVFDGARFEFDRHHRRSSELRNDPTLNCYTVVVLGPFGDPVDIMAWRPGHRAALWLGKVTMAGEEHVLAPRLGGPLHVHSDILGWLRASREGVVILDYARAARQLEGVTLRVADLEHAERLRVALARPAPQIVVEETVYNIHDKARGRAA